MKTDKPSHPLNHVSTETCTERQLILTTMVDDDNEPAQANCPVANETIGDIFSGWLHSGSCEHRSTVHQDAQPELKFRMSSETEPTNLCLFEVIYEGKVFTSST